MKIFCLFCVAVALSMTSVWTIGVSRGITRNNSTTSSQQKDVRDVEDLCTDLVDMINIRNFSGIYDLYSMKGKNATNIVAVQEYVENLLNKKGIITEIKAPEILGNWARFELSTKTGNWILEISRDKNGMIDSIVFKDPGEPIFTPARNSTVFVPPFSGRWLVVAGGISSEDNAHFKISTSKNSRLATDFVKLNDQNEFVSGDGDKNEDYSSFGSDINSVADGEIVMVVNGVPDNQPGTLNPHNYSGNTVVIKHKEFEFSSYMHLKNNSIPVKVNDKVKSGQRIGSCGNSGTSRRPHLHFQLTNSDVAALATGYPAYFSKVRLLKASFFVVVDDHVFFKDDIIEMP